MGKMVKTSTGIMYILYRTLMRTTPTHKTLPHYKLPIPGWTTQEDNDMLAQVNVQASTKNEMHLFASCSCVISQSSKISDGKVYGAGAGG